MLLLLCHSPQGKRKAKISLPAESSEWNLKQKTFSLKLCSCSDRAEQFYGSIGFSLRKKAICMLFLTISPITANLHCIPPTSAKLSFVGPELRSNFLSPLNSDRFYHRFVEQTELNPEKKRQAKRECLVALCRAASCRLQASKPSWGWNQNYMSCSEIILRGRGRSTNRRTDRITSRVLRKNRTRD